MKDFYKTYRAHIDLARATDRLRVGWNGQFAAEESDPMNFSDLQDMGEGWNQYMIDEAPDQVMGITLDVNDPLGYTVDKIQVGKTASGENGFKSLDALGFHLRHEYIHKLFRKKTDLAIIVGDELAINDNAPLFNSDKEPTEILARDLLLKNQSFGGMKPEFSDEFPSRGIFVSQLKNISYYYQPSATRRTKPHEDHKQKGVVEYWYGRQDHVINVAEGAAMVHPDSIEMFSEKHNKWMTASETWKADVQTGA